MKRYLALFLTVILVFSFALGAAAKEKQYDKMDYQQALQDYKESRLVSLAAATCAGTYAPNGAASEYSYLGEYGFIIRPYTVNDGKREANFMLAYNNQIEAGKKIFILAFRGSANKKDWEVNFETAKVAYGGSNREEFSVMAQETDDASIPAVHKGFNEYVNAAVSLRPD